MKMKKERVVNKEDYDGMVNQAAKKLDVVLDNCSEKTRKEMEFVQEQIKEFTKRGIPVHIFPTFLDDPVATQFNNMLELMEYNDDGTLSDKTYQLQGKVVSMMAMALMMATFTSAGCYGETDDLKERAAMIAGVLYGMAEDYNTFWDDDLWEKEKDKIIDGFKPAALWLKESDLGKVQEND